MRITTGKYRNKKIFAPRGIRPTQDKVRKAVFDILGDISDLTFLELFAGSGAMAIEALSRGVSQAVLVESSRDSVISIKRNMENLSVSNWSLLNSEAEKAIRFLRQKGQIFDIIFFDPPYYKDLAKKTLQTLEPYDILSPNGLVVAQHFKTEELGEISQKLVLLKSAKYGDTWISIFRKKE